MWNKVELLINDDTNTVRLCNGSAQLGDNTLYQVDTLVKLSSSENVSSEFIYFRMKNV